MDVNGLVVHKVCGYQTLSAPLDSLNVAILLNLKRVICCNISLNELTIESFPIVKLFTLRMYVVRLRATLA